MDTFAQDVHYAFRTLGKNRGFTSLAVLCLALGIGVNATIFSVVNGILIKPFPFRDPERIVALRETFSKNGSNRNGVSYVNFQDWRELTHSFDGLAATSGRSISFTDGDEPERVQGETISWTSSRCSACARNSGACFVRMKTGLARPASFS
jgi:hypothetical protein